MEDKYIEVKLQRFGLHTPNSVIHLLARECTSRDYQNDVVGVCVEGQDVTSEKFVMENSSGCKGIITQSYKAYTH